MRKPFLFFVLAALLFSFVSCSESAPSIVYGNIRLVRFQEAGGIKDKYSFFIIPEDDDGIDDIVDFYLYHDKEGLRWHFTPEDWITIQIEGNTWIGSRAISTMDNEALPRGQFRAVLIDKAGERSERNFTFDAPARHRFSFPTLELDGLNYKIKSDYPENKFIFFDSMGNFLLHIDVTQLEGVVPNIQADAILAYRAQHSAEEMSHPSGSNLEAYTVVLWAEDAEYSCAALTEAYLLPR